MNDLKLYIPKYPGGFFRIHYKEEYYFYNTLLLSPAWKLDPFGFLLEYIDRYSQANEIEMILLNDYVEGFKVLLGIEN